MGRNGFEDVHAVNLRSCAALDSSSKSRMQMQRKHWRKEGARKTSLFFPCDEAIWNRARSGAPSAAVSVRNIAITSLTLDGTFATLRREGNKVRTIRRISEAPPVRSAVSR